MIIIKSKKRLLTFLVVLIFGIIVFFIGLGSTGLVDETPPLFAAAAKAMSESGDWLTATNFPKVLLEPLKKLFHLNQKVNLAIQLD